MFTYTKKLKTVIEAEIEVLTPLHISSGKSFQPSDVVRDEDSFFVINEHKLLKRHANDPEALKELENPKLILQKFFENHPDLYIDDYMLYELEARTQKTVRYGMPLASFCRRGADFTPYIPGSSLKGTLLSGILWDMNQAARDEKDKWTSRVFIDALKRSFDRAGNTNVNDTEFLNAILGKDSSSYVQKAFRVNDADVSPEDIGVFAVATYHCDKANGTGYHWTGQKKEPTTDFKNINYDLIEAIKPGSKIKVTITVDHNALKNVTFGDLGETLRNKPFDFSEVAGAIFELGYNTLYSEYEFFNRTGHKKLTEVTETLYNNAVKIAEDASSKEIMFRLGWGMNYHGVTGFLWQDNIIKRLNLPMPRYDKFPYPKSRRIIFDGKYEAGTPGWVKMHFNA